MTTLSRFIERTFPLGLILGLAGLMIPAVHYIKKDSERLARLDLAREQQDCDKLLGLARTSLDSVTVLAKWGSCLQFVPVPQVVDEQPVRLR